MVEQNIRMPLVKGFIKADRIYIIDCPLCRRGHTHENNSYKIGDYTTRVPHCDNYMEFGASDRRLYNNYLIEIVGELTKDLQKIYTKNSKKPYERLHYIEVPISKIGVN